MSAHPWEIPDSQGIAQEALAIHITTKDDGREFVDHYPTLHAALNAGTSLLLTYPESVVDASFADDRGLQFYMHRETIHDNFVTVAGNIDGRIDITDYLGG